MKTFYLLTVTIILISCSQEELGNSKKHKDHSKKQHWIIVDSDMGITNKIFSIDDNNVKQGFQYEFYESGNIKSIEKYKNDSVIDFIYRYHEDGTLSEKTKSYYDSSTGRVLEEYIYYENRIDFKKSNFFNISPYDDTLITTENSFNFKTRYYSHLPYDSTSLLIMNRNDTILHSVYRDSLDIQIPLKDNLTNVKFELHVIRKIGVNKFSRVRIHKNVIVKMNK